MEEILSKETAYDDHLEATQKALNEAAQAETAGATEDDGIYAGPAAEEPQFFGTRTLMDDPDAFDRRQADTAAAPKPEIVYARFFDITILDENGDEVTPAAPVKVSIELLDADQDEEIIQTADSAQVIHFGEDETELMEAEVLEDTVAGVAFDTEGFSVYGVVYTVDFHWTLDGKEYVFSIPGGGFVSFEKLVEVLGIAKKDVQDHSIASSENQETQEEKAEETDAAAEVLLTLDDVVVSEETKKFVADVESVTFSDPELVWVGKVDVATTVGALKEANGLECAYSAVLTEEEIEAINAQTVEAGDWALIGMQPFTTAETLTITMKNGDQFVVSVTDDSRLVNRLETLDAVLAADGNATFLIYSSSRNTNRYLKNDGTTTTTPPTASTLSNYTWKIERHGGGSYYIQSTRNNNYLNLNSNGTDKSNIYSNTKTTVKLDEVSSRYSIHTGSRELYWSSDKYGVRDYITQPASMNIYYIDNNPESESSDVDGIVLTEAERAELQKWEDTLKKFNTLTDYSKTAEVFNYDNRIYKIDLSADAGVTDFYKNVDLGFVLDVSNSMNFPSSLAPLKRANGTDVSINMNPDTFDQLLNNTDFKAKYENQGCFYVISDPGLTSTIYKIYKDGSTWKYRDASSNSTTVYDLTTDTVFKEAVKQAYTIYYADDKTPRFTYLKNSVNYAIEMLNKIVTPTDNVDDGTASVRIAYNLFASTIKGSDTFTDLRDRGDTLYSLTWSNTDSGTKQNEALFDGNHSISGYSANEFGWETTNPTDKYVILVTDGAPNGPTMNEVRTAAQNLKNAYPGLKIISIGLSTQDVDGGSQMLFDIADDIGGIRQFYEAEKANDLEYILLKILRTIMAKGLVRGTITDTIDSAFYPVDADGNPLTAGVYNSIGGKINGAQVGSYTSSDPYYTWEQVGDNWKITWYNQEIGWDDDDLRTGEPWNGTVYVKAKEDYLGGNLISTNDGNATIEPTGIKLVINGAPETNWRPLQWDDPIKLPVPRVNVHSLESDGNSTTWTVYRDTSVTPKEQIKALWENVPIEEVVSETVNHNHKVRTQNGQNVGTNGDGETFKLKDLLDEMGIHFDIDSLIDRLGSGANASVTSAPITYTAYGHESGAITVKLERTAGTKPVTEHGADVVTGGGPSEQYKLTVTYQPYSETVRDGVIVSKPESGYEDHTNHHNGSGERGDEAGPITSTNTHTINVFQKGIKVTKVDKTDLTKVLPGAVFELYRADADGDADVSAYNLPSGNYSKVGYDLTADTNGVITIDPVIPDKDIRTVNKTLYLPNIDVGASENTSHGTVFYLVEKTPPNTYGAMPGAIKFTMTLTENKGSASANTLYDWTQSAEITTEEYENGTTEYLLSDVGTNADVYAYKIKNGKTTDLTLIKVDRMTGRSIGGAKFSLVRGAEIVDLTKLTITALKDDSVVTPESYEQNDTMIPVVTVPEGGLRIAGLADDTYTLTEVAAPAGYVITDSGKTFKTDNGAIKNGDDTAHENESANIAFKVENERGAALPSTGGPGTELFTILGTAFVLGSGALLIRRKETE